MSERLAAHAVRLCGLVCRNLQWRPQDFWSATPCEIAMIFTDETAADHPQIDRQWLTQMMERDAHG